MTGLKTSDFLPTTRDEMNDHGWDQLDVLLITGDAYFDHPSHGAAVIGRVLERAGYRVGIVARPDWKSTDDFTRMGRPRLFAGVTAGAVDSMLNNYTADRKRRRDDAYAPGREGMGRPNLATLVYAGRLKEAFPALPIILGGVEASTRRFAYFDYMKDRIRRSILVDTRADLLVFGPGEKQVIEIATRLRDERDLFAIPGTARLLKREETPHGLALPDYATVEKTPVELIAQTKLLEGHMGPGHTQAFYQSYVEGVVQAEPPVTMTTAEFDAIAALPFIREAHPSYTESLPALETVRWSIIATRGCPGGCSFCALAMHQGRGVVSRSEQSVLDEVKILSRQKKFSGTISDIGGPTANSFGQKPQDLERCRRCRRPSCYHPKLCDNLDVDHSSFIAVLRKARALPGIKRVLIASGIRHDLALRAPNFIKELAAHHTGGHLKVAPEHVSAPVLSLMRKPSIADFEAFEKQFLQASHDAGLRQYLVPYFIAGFPGCEKEIADESGRWLRKRGQILEQVQTFIPLPGTMAAALYAARQKLDGTPIFIPDEKERRRQKALLTEKAERFHDHTLRRNVHAARTGSGRTSRRPR